jgi:AAA family ATP:ADP antiporter
MGLLRRFQRQMFDIRPGEHLRTWAMFAYLLFVLFAYYIVKPVSRAMFLNKFNIDALPGLYILIAVFGGVLAYLYSKLATRTSLRTAVLWATAISVASLAVMWWLIGMRLPWMIYVLNIWVSLFSIVSVSQGWLVASNIFNTREAKRLYPLLGMGMVVGAAFGGEFTNRTAHLVGSGHQEDLLLASAAMVILAYVSFRFAVRGSGTALEHARGAKKEETDFTFRQMMNDLGRVRHLQIIVGMMLTMYLVDTLVEYQFQAMAGASFHGADLTAYFGQFYGIYLNGVELIFQLFLTAVIVRWFGVGGTLHVSPAAVAFSSVATIAAPGVASASAVRLTEASTRYTLNKTGMELLYMPLPLELRNRIKAFIDICVDRLSRGLGGVLLILLTKSWLHLDVKGIAIVVVALTIPWLLLSHWARKEYVATIRRRLEGRRLDIESVRVGVSDADTLKLLETTALGRNARQAAYALGLLAEAPGYDVRPLLERLAPSAEYEIRERVYQIAGSLRFDGAMEQAVKDLRAAQETGAGVIPPAAAPYALSVAPDRVRLAREFLNAANPVLVEGVLEHLAVDRVLAEQLITPEWLEQAAASPDARHRGLAATALAARGDGDTELLQRLVADPDPQTAAVAFRAVGRLRSRACLFPLIHGLGNPRLRGDAIGALTAFGSAICGTLSDVLLDEEAPRKVRRQIPRVLRNIPDQRSVNVLVAQVGHPDLEIRAAVLKALNRLRESQPELTFDHMFITGQILKEAHHYAELNAALEPFREDSGQPATRLLARSIEQRLHDTLERLFRLLGLRYPARQIYSAYRAFQGRNHEDAVAAMELLDNVLERDLKRILLPLLDAPDHLLEAGRELFGVEVPSTEAAIRDLIRSRDPWLVACAMAAAAEMQLRSMAGEIARASETAATEVAEVARSAESVLAA